MDIDKKDYHKGTQKGAQRHAPSRALRLKGQKFRFVTKKDRYFKRGYWWVDIVYLII